MLCRASRCCSQMERPNPSIWTNGKKNILFPHFSAEMNPNFFYQNMQISCLKVHFWHLEALHVNNLSVICSTQHKKGSRIHIVDQSCTICSTLAISILQPVEMRKGNIVGLFRNQLIVHCCMETVMIMVGLCLNRL